MNLILLEHRQIGMQLEAAVIGPANHVGRVAVPMEDPGNFLVVIF
jgi:hypothetical protein